MRQTLSSGFLTVRFKPAFSATETSWKIIISLEASSDMMLSNRRITKLQIAPPPFTMACIQYVHVVTIHLREQVRLIELETAQV